MSIHACISDECGFQVMLTPSGWAHVDTHGIPTDHPAWPADLPRPEDDPMPTDLPANIIANLSSESGVEEHVIDPAPVYFDGTAPDGSEPLESWEGVTADGETGPITEEQMVEAAAARVRREAQERIDAIEVVRMGEPLTVDSPFTYTRTVPDLEIATAEYWAGWSDAEDHIARLLGWTIQEAPGD